MSTGDGGVRELLREAVRRLPPPGVLVGTALYLLFVAVMFEAMWGAGGRASRVFAAALGAVFIGVPTFWLWSQHMYYVHVDGLRDQAVIRKNRPHWRREQAAQQAEQRPHLGLDDDELDAAPAVLSSVPDPAV